MQDRLNLNTTDSKFSRHTYISLPEKPTLAFSYDFLEDDYILLADHLCAFDEEFLEYKFPFSP